MSENIKSIINNAREGVQPRDPKFGKGENHRVWEVDYHGIKIGINLGDIASAPTEAIMCPTTPWLEVGGGAIENRIADVAGDEVFGVYTKEIIRMLTQVRDKDHQKSITAAGQLLKFLESSTGTKLDKLPKDVRSDVLIATSTDNLGHGIGEHVALFYGGSIPAPAGKELGKKGIKVIVLTNVTPQGQMRAEDMVRFTESAAQAAGLTGVDSLTVPAVGTGFAAAMGFGMSQAESLAGFFKGTMSYIDHNQSQTKLKHIDYNIYARPTVENAKNVTGLLKSSETTKLLS